MQFPVTNSHKSGNGNLKPMIVDFGKSGNRTFKAIFLAGTMINGLRGFHDLTCKVGLVGLMSCFVLVCLVGVVGLVGLFFCFFI